MAEKKKTESATEEPKPFKGGYGSEVKCQRCQGMVNHNGCADAECPVAAANR